MQVASRYGGAAFRAQFVSGDINIVFMAYVLVGRRSDERDKHHGHTQAGHEKQDVGHEDAEDG